MIAFLCVFIWIHKEFISYSDTIKGTDCKGIVVRGTVDRITGIRVVVDRIVGVLYVEIYDFSIIVL